MILTVSSRITLFAFAFSVHANSSTLTLSNAFLHFCPYNLYISTVMLLYRDFLRGRNSPFNLKAASITCKVCWKFELFAFNISFSAATRKRAILVSWFIEGNKNFEICLICSHAQSYCAVALWCRMNNLPCNKVSWLRCCNKVKWPLRCSSTGLLFEVNNIR